MQKPELPFLEKSAWSGERVDLMDEEELISLYQTKWKYQDVFGKISGDELMYVKYLAKKYQSVLLAELGY